jgi:aspergillopepsin I
MFFSSIIAAAGLLTVGIQARYVKRADGVTIFSRKPVAYRSPSEVVTTSVVLPLTRKAATGASAARRQALSSLATIANGSTTSLTSLFIGEEFAAEVTFGTETFELIVDTGSSDTWVVETGFVCTDLSTGKTTTEAYCDFGPYYTKSSTFVAISGEDFSIEYGDGEYLTGIMGTEEVTVAGITVDQEVALVTAAAWEGDGTTSGLMGLAYPAL